MEEVLQIGSGGSKESDTSGPEPQAHMPADYMDRNGEPSGKERKSKRSSASWLFEYMEEESGDGSAQLEAQVLTTRQREAITAYRQQLTIDGVAEELGVKRAGAVALLRAAKDRLGIERLEDLEGVPPGIGERLAGESLDDTVAVTEVRLLDLLKAQDFRCALSGMELTPQTAQLDHRIPRSKGGMHDMTNVQFLHRDVNRAKNTMTQDDFIQMCRRVSQWQECTAAGGSGS